MLTKTFILTFKIQHKHVQKEQFNITRTVVIVDEGKDAVNAHIAMVINSTKDSLKDTYTVVNTDVTQLSQSLRD